MSRAAIYTSMTDKARPAAAWWAIPQVFLIFAASMLTAALTAFLLGLAGLSIMILSGRWDPAAGAEPPALMYGFAAAGGAFGLYLSIAGFSLLKVKLEKRSFASAGLDGFLYGPRFWAGFLGGMAVAVGLGIPAALAGMVFGVPEPVAAMNPEVLISGKFALAVVCILAFVLVQAPAEEIFARGWLLSALGWRHGLVPALIISSVIFALLHADRVIAGLGWLLYAILAVGGVGLLFAGIAYAARSVVPAAGMHTGYNFCLMTIGVAFVLAQSEDGTFISALEKLVDLSELPPFELSGPMLIDMASRALIPLVLTLWLVTSRRRAANA